MWAPFPTKRRIFVFPSFYEPFSWIVFDILPYFVVILLIADHIVIIGTLKNRFSNFFCHKHLDRTHNIGHPIMLLFCTCRGRCPHRPVIQPDHYVDMIRHDHIFIHRQMVIKCIHLPDVFVSDFSIGQQFRALGLRTPGDGCPYDLCQYSLPVLGTDGDEIRTILAVIKSPDAVGVSFGQFHRIHPS